MATSKIFQPGQFISRRERTAQITYFEATRDENENISYERVFYGAVATTPIKSISRAPSNVNASTIRVALEMRDEDNTPDGGVFKAEDDWFAIGELPDDITDKRAAQAAGYDCYMVNSVQESRDANGKRIQVFVEGA